MSRQPPVQQPPPVQRLLLQYGKVGPTRFASHRDFARALERALRRAGVPMAYSSGFNPHPRVSYVNPAPTGAESDAEYAVLALARRCDSEAVRAGLAAVMPAGFPVLAVTETGRAVDLSASLWVITLRGVEPAEVAATVATFLAAPAVTVSRATADGNRLLEARTPVEALTCEGRECRLVIRHTIPLVRVDDVIAALCQCGLTTPAVPALTRRLAQGTVADLVA